MRRIVFGCVILAIGVMMILQKAGVYGFDWFFELDWGKYILPAALVLVGLRLIAGNRQDNNVDSFRNVDLDSLNADEVLTASVAFSGGRYIMNGRVFNGAKLDAFCGGISLDLNGADIADNCVIDVRTFMGGVEIKAPEDVNFNVVSSCLLGGVNNKRGQYNSNASKTITLKANCLLGGVDIK